MKVLVVDVGGSNVKVMASDQDEVRKVPSGKEMSAERMVKEAVAAAGDWPYEAVSLGFPGPVKHARPAVEPINLGQGWMDFDYASAFKKPVRIINDAAMQALGCYDGGRMLFLGLGTAVGSTLIVDDVIVPLELGQLRYTRRSNLEDYLGNAARKRLGQPRWERAVHKVVALLRGAFGTDYIVLGGGNAKHLSELPETARRGHNRDAFTGGLRLWEHSPSPVVAEQSTWKVT